MNPKQRFCNDAVNPKGFLLLAFTYAVLGFMCAVHCSNNCSVFPPVHQPVRFAALFCLLLCYISAAHLCMLLLVFEFFMGCCKFMSLGRLSDTLKW